MKQVQAVIKFVSEILDQTEFDSRPKLSKEQFEAVTTSIVKGMQNGEVDLSDKARAKYDTEEKLNTYVKGMINNHLIKAPYFNGGEKYEPKNPGARRGSSDTLLKELRKVKSLATTDEQREAIQVEIDKRIAELDAEKVKEVEIDWNLIPAHLKNLVG